MPRRRTMCNCITIKSIYIPILIVKAAAFSGCSKQHNKADYLPLVNEMHKIECEQLSGAGENTLINDTSIYSFRSKAFDRIMTKKPDAKLIAHWEELNQKLAAMEYFMDEFEKKQYKDDFRSVYMEQCK